MLTPSRHHGRRAAMLTLAALMVGAAPAAAQTFTYTLTPTYQEGVNGANGWFRTNVQATYVCDPLLFVVSCPGRATAPTGALTESFGNNAGTRSNPGSRPPARIVDSTLVTRTAVFVPPFASVTTVLESTPGVSLRIDSQAPSTPSVTVPASGAVYDAGSVQTANYACSYTNETSGPAPGTPCAGPVPSGTRLDTGIADVASTWGSRTFVVTSTDLAGNASKRTVTYNVDELPGAPTSVEPAVGAMVDSRPVLLWNAPADDGSGFSQWRLRISPASGSVRNYTSTATGTPVAFQPPDDLPAGGATWSVTFVDARGRSATGETRSFTVNPALPGAPTITAAPTTTTETQPAFTWQPAEPGGSFTWEITGVNGTTVQGPSTTAATSATAAALQPGSYAFRVRQVNARGFAGDWSAPAPFTVVAPAPAIQAIPTPTPGGLIPRTENAKRLLPKAGSLVGGRPLFRWKRNSHATLYNFQVFRYSQRRYIKVHTAFPRGTKYRIPKGKLVSGRRYVWRVWPYMGGVKKYSTRPVGISWFDAR